MLHSDSGEFVVEGLACRRGERPVFAGIGCRLPAGGALLLTGANGSGKSSLLRIFATLLAPTAGHLSWDGAPVVQDAARYRAALHYIGHLDATKPALTAREMLHYWTALRGGATLAIGAALAAFGLEAVGDWPCRWLSAGQRRRLALARLLSAPAPLWLLDEPTAALDSDGKARLITAIAEHRASGGSVAMATHEALGLPAAQTIALDDFGVAPEAALAALW